MYEPAFAVTDGQIKMTEKPGLGLDLNEDFIAEYRARDYLEGKSIECFLPIVRTSLPRRGREDAPLFPGYLLTRYNLEEWGAAALRWGQGLAGIVAFEDVAPSVPDEVIEELWQLTADINEGGGLWRRFKPGDRVVVRLGSLESESLAEVVAEAKSPQGRVRVLMNFIGKLAHAEVPWQNLRPALDSVAGGKADEYHPRRRTRGRGRYLRGVGPRAPQNGCSST